MSGIGPKLSTAALYLSVAAAAFLAFGWPFTVSRDQGSGAYHVVSVGVLLIFFASLTVLCVQRLRASRDDKSA